MPKLPYMPFYPGDYLKDTRQLPNFVKGIWMDLICYLWDAPKRGRAEATLQDWVRACGSDEAEFLLAVDTLEMKQICEVNRTKNSLIFSCRRMLRDEKKRNQTRRRVAKHRATQQESQPLSNADVTQSVTHLKRPSNGDIPYSIFHIPKEEKKEEKKAAARSPRLSDEQWWEAMKQNPAYAHVDWTVENGKMDAWLLTNPGRKKTRAFIVNWLNKVPKPVAVAPTRKGYVPV